MKLRITLCALASLLLALTADAVLPGQWPATDKAPPPVAEWTALVDQSKVPKAPVVKTVGTCPAKDDFCNWSCTLCTRNDTDITQCPTKGDWGLTFDDGPTEFTNTLLDFLATKNALVTFFVIGSRVFDNPEILQKAVKAGHQIGVHTWSHPALTTLTNEQIIAEIKWTEAAIKQAVGITPKYMRPPFGDYDDRVRSIASQLGYKIVIWDLDTNDWQSAEDKNFQLTWIEGNFTEWVKMPSNTGHISLEHDLYKQTAERAQLVVPIVQNAGFTIKQVAVCMGDSQPYVENVSLPTTSGAAAGGGAPAPAPAAAPAAAAGGAPAAGGSYPSNYLESPTSASSSSAMPATSSMPSTNDATSSSINLSLFIFLIMGTLVFV